MLIINSVHARFKKHSALHLASAYAYRYTLMGFIRKKYL